MADFSRPLDRGVGEGLNPLAHAGLVELRLVEDLDELDEEERVAVEDARVVAVAEPWAALLRVGRGKLKEQARVLGREIGLLAHGLVERDLHEGVHDVILRAVRPTVQVGRAAPHGVLQLDDLVAAHGALVLIHELAVRDGLGRAATRPDLTT